MNSREPFCSDELPVSCYMHEIPAFVEEELARSYETLHSSLPFLKVFRTLKHANCYVAGHVGQRRTILLFTCHKSRVEVLNEMIEIDRAGLDRFVRYVFSRFANADVIRFNALKAEAADVGFPVQRYASKSTYVIALPADPEAYTSSIGKSTRAGLRHQMNNVVRDFPTFAIKFYHNEDINEQDVRCIVKLSEDKINANGRKISHDVARILALAKSCGFVSVFLVNGKICAGSVNYKVGASYFGDVTAYDQNYEKYGMGKLCIHQTICESIRGGGKKFYLGGGVFDFKQRMLGVPLCMDEITIYRSRGRMLFNAPVFLRSALAGSTGRLKMVLHRNKQTIWAKYAYASFHFFRSRMMK